MELLSSKISGPRGSHIKGLCMLVDIDIILRVFVKSSHTKYL